MNNLYIKLKKLNDNAVIPSYAHDGDVGMDLTAISVEYDKENDAFIYHTGLAFESNFNIGQFIFPRSSNKKTDAYLANSVGVVDSAIYRGEVLVVFKNRTSCQAHAMIEAANIATESLKLDPSGFTFNDFIAFYNWQQESYIEACSRGDLAPYAVGDRVAQMIFFNCPTVNIEVVDELSVTERGANGFGSTGK